MNITVSQVIGPLIGGVVGFLFYKFIGCPSGACPITANPFTSTLYGLLLGWVIGTGR